VSFSIIRTTDRLTVKLEGSITIRDAHELASQLREMVEADVPTNVETAGIEDIDTCMLQLLYALRMSASGVAFDNPSEAFIAASERIGLRREFLGAREEL
jgi:anti-anti-sigma regulatory factor